jgi:hypothetical protein
VNSSLIGKVEKARIYAEERDRMRVRTIDIEFHGEHSVYRTGFDGSAWHCTCDFFGAWNTCSHTMALERVLHGMVPASTLPSTAGTGTPSQ